MRGFIEFVDDFVTGSTRQILGMAVLCVFELLLGLLEPVNYFCLAWAAWFGILLVLNVYSWDYQRRHSGK